LGAFQLNMQLWIRKFERNLQDHSLKVALSKSLAYLFRFGYEHRVYRLYKIDLLRGDAKLPTDIVGVTFRFLTPADEAAIRQIEENSEWLRGMVRERLMAGAVCVAAFEGKQLAGFNLVSFGKVLMPLVHLSRRFRHDEAWSEQIATVKTFRGKGLASQLRYRIFEELRRRGIRKFYGGALRDNLPSLTLARRVGFREFVEIRYTRLFTRRKWRYVRVSHESP
jgi:GNAT superfamily N-acetyltransferase